MTEPEELKPCPSCPDGYVWSYNGPTGTTCKTCKGYAVVTLNGEPCAEARARFVEIEEDYRFER